MDVVVSTKVEGLVLEVVSVYSSWTDRNGIQYYRQPSSHEKHLLVIDSPSMVIGGPPGMIIRLEITMFIASIVYILVSIVTVLIGGSFSWPGSPRSLTLIDGSAVTVDWASIHLWCKPRSPRQ